MNLSSLLTVLYNRKTREEALFWKGSSGGAIFPSKIAFLNFHTSQHKGEKIHVSSCTFRSKIHLNGPELALEENQDPYVPATNRPADCPFLIRRRIGHCLTSNQTEILFGDGGVDYCLAWFWKRQMKHDKWKMATNLALCLLGNKPMGDTWK